MIKIQGLVRIEKQSILPEYFELNSEGGFTNISTTGSLADSNMEMGSS